MRIKILPAILLTACLWMGLGIEAFAHGDTLRIKAQPGIFDMKMQRRYRPAHELFHEPGRSAFLQALENSSISLSGGYRRWFIPDVSSGPFLALSLDKWITPTHGARLEAGGGYFLNHRTRSRVKMLPDIRLSYLFNLSAYLDGYDPSRTGTLYTVAGLGYTWLQGGSGSSWTAQMGVGYSVHILRGTNLFVEPVLELNGNGFLRQADGNWRGYYGGARVNMGIQYRIDRWNTLLPPKEEHRWFLMAAGGPAWLAWSPSSSRKLGYQVSLGFGERITPAASLRLTGVWTRAYQLANRQNEATYGALRLEGMLELMKLGRQQESPLGLSILAGPEAGFLDRTQAQQAIYGKVGALGNKYYYVGATAGLQLNYRFYRGFSAFLEPRASFIPYSVLSTDGQSGQNTLDILMSANLGLQYDIPTVAQRIAAWEKTKRWTRDTRDKTRQWDRQTWEELSGRFHRQQASLKRSAQRMRLFATLEGSYFRLLGKEYTNGPLASLSLGAWFNEVNGALVNAGAGYFQDLQYGNGYLKTTEFSAAYLLNFTRLATAAPRRLNLSLLAGAGYMLPIREKWKGSPVFRTGLDMRMHVYSHTDLVARPEIDLLKAPSEKWTPALRGSLGLNFSFGSTPMSRFPDVKNEWYISLGGGVLAESQRLANQLFEEDPVGEYRMSGGIGRRYSSRLDGRVSFSFVSQIKDRNHGGSFAHRLRFATVNVDALYNVLADGSPWALSLLGGPEMGIQHRTGAGENAKGGLLRRKTLSAYLGASAGLQLKYRFSNALSAYLEPRYSVIPYVALSANGQKNYYSHLYGANIGLEYAFVREKNRRSTGGTPARGKDRAYTFVQATGTIFAPFGRAYGNGPLASIGVGHWFGSPHGILLEAGAGYFRDNQFSVVEGKRYTPQHMAAGEIRASYLLSLSRLASREEILPVQLSLITGMGYMLPEIRQKDKGTFTAHGGFDLRIHALPGADLVIQPQLELLQDPHSVVDGSRNHLRGAFRGSFGLSYNLSRWKPYPATDWGKDWFVAVSAGVQKEMGQRTEEAGTEFSHNEYRLGLAVGRRYVNGMSLRLSGSFSEQFPRESSFLHSLRYASVNLDILYDLLASEQKDRRWSLSLLAGPEGGLFNKNYSGANNEYPMPLPLRMGRRVNHGIAAYFGLSAGLQLKARVAGGLSLYLEPRYSLVPYVITLSPEDHRNMASHLWNVNLGVQYSFGQKR